MPEALQPTLHHVNLRTTRQAELIGWYGTVVGLTVVHEFPMGAWLTNDAANHRLALLSFPEITDDPEKRAHSGIDHLAFEYMLTSPEFHENPLGHFFDPERVQADRAAGMTLAEIREGTMSNRYRPDPMPDLPFELPPGGLSDEHSGSPPSRWRARGRRPRSSVSHARFVRAGDRAAPAPRGADVDARGDRHDERRLDEGQLPDRRRRAGETAAAGV